MALYQMFGLVVHSEIDLQPLTTLEHGEPDVFIITAPVNTNGLEKPICVFPYCQQAANEVWLNIPGIARFYIVEGKKITVDAAPNVDPQSVELYILGSCMAAVLYQRKNIVIHGNAIKIGSKSVIIAGDSGSGKSTLAAGFYKHGYEILSDDLSVINQNLSVQPSYPQIKLWNDAISKLEINLPNLRRIRMHVEKYALPMESGYFHSELPVAGVYTLNYGNDQDVVFKPLSGIEKFETLRQHTYREQWLEGMRLEPNHISVCGRLANQTFITQIIRPKDYFNIDAMVSMIVRDVQNKKVAA